MFKKIQGLLIKCRVSSFYAPVTVKGILFFSVLYFTISYLQNSTKTTTTAYSAILGILLKVSIFFIGIFIVVGLIFITVSWIYLQYFKNKKAVQLTILPIQSEASIHKQEVKIIITHCIKPIMGFIKLRLFFGDNKYSSKYILHTTNAANNNINSVEGIFYWNIPEIKEYNIEKTVVYFEDIFRFFSLVVPIHSLNRFIAHPECNEINTIDPTPRKTEETFSRIDQMRKVEGEYLNYKNFETNDDVRRIVWKVYAKNKELIVRIPEILDPYASHVYLYPSFYSALDVEFDAVVNTAFLNYYKIIIWSVYNSMIKKGYNVQYITDSSSRYLSKTDNPDIIKQHISTSNWQSEKSLKDFIQFNDASIVIISSLSDVNNVKELYDRHGREINFIYVKLTDYLNLRSLLHWVEWLFLINKNENIEEIKRKWLFSRLKNKLKENEASIEKVLNPIQFSKKEY